MKPLAEWRLEGLGHNAGGSRRAFASAQSLLTTNGSGWVQGHRALGTVSRLRSTRTGHEGNCIVPGGQALIPRGSVVNSYGLVGGHHQHKQRAAIALFGGMVGLDQPHGAPRGQFEFEHNLG